jgi:hypothetical protein
MLFSLQDSLQEMNEACQAYASNLTAILFLAALALGWPHPALVQLERSLQSALASHSCF